jgi:hypothetical protein
MENHLLNDFPEIFNIKKLIVIGGVDSEPADI